MLEDGVIGLRGESVTVSLTKFRSAFLRRGAALLPSEDANCYCEDDGSPHG